MRTGTPEDGGTPEDTRPPARTGRRGLLVGALLVVALLAGVLAAAAGLGPGQDADDPAGASAGTSTSSAAPSATPLSSPSGTAEPTPVVPSPSGPPLSEAPDPQNAVVADELPPDLAPVPLDGTAEAADDGISATLESLEAIEGTGVGPGEVAGPALRVTVRVANDSAEPVDLDAVVVNASSGEDEVPAPTLGDPSAAPFAGSLEPGGTADGVYVFRVPVDARDLVTVSVGYRADAPFLVFSGAAA